MPCHYVRDSPSSSISSPAASSKAVTGVITFVTAHTFPFFSGFERSDDRCHYVRNRSSLFISSPSAFGEAMAGVVTFVTAHPFPFPIHQLRAKRCRVSGNWGGSTSTPSYPPVWLTRTDATFHSTRTTTFQPSAPASRMAHARHPRRRRLISAFQPRSAHSARTRISASEPNWRRRVSACILLLAAGVLATVGAFWSGVAVVGLGDPSTGLIGGRSAAAWATGCRFVMQSMTSTVGGRWRERVDGVSDGRCGDGVAAVVALLGPSVDDRTAAVGADEDCCSWCGLPPMRSSRLAPGRARSSDR